MAPRTIKATETETVSALKESTALPISVGNPMAADLLAIDQSHMEEFATAEEKSFDVRIESRRRAITSLCARSRSSRGRTAPFISYWR